MSANLAKSQEIAYFAGGCFWGVEYGFTKVPGVLRAESGYQQGHMVDPDYDSVCKGTTGHTESVRVTYDKEKVAFGTLCKFFLYLIDPTTLNSQGADHGTQYRSGIYVTSPEQLKTAQ